MKWTREPPTKPGWYWFRSPYTGVPMPLQVLRTDIGIRVQIRDDRLEPFSYFRPTFAGPIHGLNKEES